MHNQIIQEIGKDTLGSIGCFHKGKSRIWYDDRGFFIVVIEFQPSNWKKGTYVNISIHWLWSTSEVASLDYDLMDHKPFLEFKNEQQFRTGFIELAKLAKRKVLECRQQIKTIQDVAELLSIRSKLTDVVSWNTFHAAIALALANRVQESSKLFAEISNSDFDDKHSQDWVLDRGELCKKYTALLKESPQVFQAELEKVIQNKRKNLKLPNRAIGSLLA